jgi:hypothetical protein
MSVKTNSAQIRYYDIKGMPLAQPQKGLNIVQYKMSNGTIKTKKIYQ